MGKGAAVELTRWMYRHVDRKYMLQELVSALAID